ncbi:MAG TPA: aminotransferase class I/II-fold pyridoxal phosphate-dependent enzyme [Gemmatimonadaceae bacterium]|nr:aminotransferase class I/II-fold pyridoxal phosphate-dependent enzyme [Gemmatimonadaceae bacterium]
MTTAERAPGVNTLLIHADDDVDETSSIAPPIYQTATFRGSSADDLLTMATRPRHHRFYTRYENQTHAHAEAVIAALEKAEAAMLTASGMGAITTTLLTLLNKGDHIIAQQNHYPGTTGLIRDHLSRWGVESTVVDQRSVDDFAAAIRSNTRVMMLESPSNPLLRLTDLAAVAQLAREHGIVTVCDNTFATPINQRPIELGVDIVVHSATKYLSGHSDVIAGAIAGPAELLDRIWHASIDFGASLGPLDGWLLLRGLRTLGLRMERHNRTGVAVAKFLEQHPAVRTVNFPGLASHPQHELACRQMSGPSGVLSFELKGGFEAAERFVSALEIPARAPSVGGVDSLIVHPAAMLAKTMSAEQFAAVGVRPDLLRLSVGLEDEADLMRDLDQALR